MELNAVDLGNMATPSDVIFGALRDEIIRGNLKAGESVRQEVVAKAFNVSRIPVREALMRLEAQGLLEKQRYKGYVVTSLSAKDVEEIFEVRSILEPLVIERAVEQMKPETLEQARQFCDSFSNENDSAKWGEWNRLFHAALYKDSERPYQLKIVDESMDLVDSYLRAQLVLTNGMEKATREHNGILDACVQGDGKLAAMRTRDHIQGAYKVLIEFLKDQQSG